jgi:hypothetical protein
MKNASAFTKVAGFRQRYLKLYRTLKQNSNDYTYVFDVVHQVPKGATHLDAEN